jgi:ABC-type nickel/cobalt efflux system permease component RcnA
MTEELSVLVATAASIGLLHTLIGPDHYVPFIAMAGARQWSLSRTLKITLACGVGHVVGSLALGALGILLGWAVTGLEWLEGVRGQLAGWLLLGFGIAYTAWGLRQALRHRPHSHRHHHGDGTVHEHRHGHRGEHAHVHPAPVEAATARQLTPWILFTIFVFGPCEPLIPVLMYPAAGGNWGGVALVAAVFAACTVMTMVGMVTIGYLGLSQVAFARLERYSHAVAGLALVACGVAIQTGL